MDWHPCIFLFKSSQQRLNIYISNMRLKLTTLSKAYGQADGRVANVDECMVNCVETVVNLRVHSTAYLFTYDISQ